jgi:hypothetical protein
MQAIAMTPMAAIGRNDATIAWLVRLAPGRFI